MSYVNKLFLLVFSYLALSVQLQAEIRQFDLATIERLGTAIYEQDIRAAVASDMVFAQKIDVKKEGLKGWVVEGDAKQMLVRFVREKNGQLEAFYDIHFKGRNRPLLVKPSNTKLTAVQIAQLKARSLAAKNIKRPGSRRYNFVILPDPEGDRLLVYALAATLDHDKVLVGGHYRFTVSKDGEKLVQSDELFRSFLVLNKKPTKDIPSDGKIAGFTMSSVVSNLPLETHVYLSLLHKLPFFVVTPDRRVWKSGNGKLGIFKEFN